MTARAHPLFALRPYLPQDAPFLAEIFRASVEELTEDDYSLEQREAWASAAEDLDAFAKRLAKHLTLVATLEGSVIGFISLDSATEIGLFYVHPAAAGQGAGAMLYDAVERLSAARGTAHLSVDASDNALDFFKSRGFAAQQRNSMAVGDEWISNTTMKKTLAAKERAQ
ncbi:MAG: GNAT family N-acetyltransferase [Alphaproteobacteria bacterium]|nr:GNAT family N-acetyltransferase [Alphaproteobacteria bacterium]